MSGPQNSEPRDIKEACSLPLKSAHWLLFMYYSQPWGRTSRLMRELSWQCRAMTQHRRAAPSRALQIAMLGLWHSRCFLQGWWQEKVRREHPHIIYFLWGTLSWEPYMHHCLIQYSPQANVVSVPFYRWAHWDLKKSINDAYVKRTSPATRRTCNWGWLKQGSASSSCKKTGNNYFQF